MGGQDELRVREIRLEQSAHFAPMAGIDGHQDIIEHRKGELVAERVLHQGQIQAHAHTVLMPLTMIGTGRECPTAIEIDVETEFGGHRLQLADELAFIVIDSLVELREFLGDGIVDVFEDLVGYGVVVVIDLLRRCIPPGHALGGLGRCGDLS